VPDHGDQANEDLKFGVVDRFRAADRPLRRAHRAHRRRRRDQHPDDGRDVARRPRRRFRPNQPVYVLALAFALVLGFSYVFSWISAFIGLAVRDPETAQGDALSPALGTLAWLTGLLLVFVPLSVRAFRRT